MKQKQRDLLVLSHLRKHARQTLTQMSRKTRVPISTLHEMLKWHSKNSDWRYTVLTDFAQMGYQIKAHVLFKVKKEKKEDLRKRLLNNPYVNSLYKVNNGYDFLSEVYFQKLYDLEEFLENMQESCSAKAEVHHIMKDLKREEFMADPEVARNVLDPAMAR